MPSSFSGFEPTSGAQNLGASPQAGLDYSALYNGGDLGGFGGAGTGMVPDITGLGGVGGGNLGGSLDYSALLNGGGVSGFEPTSGAQPSPDQAPDPYGPDSGRGQDTLSNMGQPNDTAPGLMDAIRGTGGQAADLIADNPRLAATAVGALAGAGGGGGGGGGPGGYVDDGYRPTITRTPRAATGPALPQQPQQPLQKPSGLLSMPTTPGFENSGLWRYGLFGRGR